MTAMRRDPLTTRLWAIAVWALVIFFVVNLIAMVATVVVNSFGTRWFGTWLPAGFTARWYASAWDEFQLGDVLIGVGLASGPIRLVHNYTGVLLSLVVSGFPFTFLLTLSYVTGIDPSLEQAASTLGAGPRARFWHVFLPLLAPGLAITFCLSFVQAFSVFPSAVLLGVPAGVTRVISIAAYTAAYEQYDYSRASAIAMIMGAAQLVVVVLVLAGRSLAYRGPMGGGKG